MEKSNWNGDLDNRAEYSARLFRFTPKDSTFAQLPPDGKSWQDLSQKIAPAALKHFVL